MSNVVTKPKPLPDITSIVDLQRNSEENHNRKLAFFPSSYHLIVTTTRSVLAWDMDGVIELFRSASGGIVAAKRLTDNDELLAVADSQVVILHDINKGMQKSYRLKGTEGQVRLLKYARNASSKNLFFTTSLRNSVQTFSLTHAKMLDPSDSHPSPPSVFAISCTSHLLLSTSASPPTIYLRELGQNVPPILLLPRCSSSAVTAADFHPEAANVFILAFADGSAAVYDASLIFRDTEFGGHSKNLAAAEGEIASIKGLHAISSKMARNAPGDGERVTDPKRTSIQSQVSSITAVALVPGYKATAITVGADGKCCVVDFTQFSRNKAVLLKSWNLRRPATSLSVVFSKAPTRLSMDGAINESGSTNADYCIAVGRQDGKVLLFDLDGKALGKRILDPKGASVVDVEWVKKENDATLVHTVSSMPESWKNVPKRKSLGTETMKSSKENESKAVQRRTVGCPSDALFSLPKDDLRSSETSVMAFNHLDLPHAANLEARTRADENNASLDKRLDSGNTFLNPSTPKTYESHFLSFSDSPPPVPPRPTPKPGGKLSQRRSTAGRVTQVQPNDIKPTILSIGRRKTGNDASPTKIPAQMISPTKATSPWSRSLLDLQAGSWEQVPRDYSNCVSSQSTQIPPQESEVQTRPSRDSPALPARLGDIASRIELPAASNPWSVPKLSSLPKLREPLLVRSSSASPRRYESVSSRFGLSENSTDTVVDWVIASASHRLEPSIRGPSPIRTATDLSVFRATTLEVAREEGKSETKKDKHESARTLTQTTPSFLSSIQYQPQDSANTETTLDWPSLRISPRTSNINAGAASATASALDLGGSYRNSNPSERARHQVLSLPNPPTPPRRSSSSSKTDRYIPPRLPLPVSRRSTTNNVPDVFQNAATTHICPCPCRSQIQALVTASLDTFRVEIAHGFEAQRLWIEDLVRARASRSGEGEIGGGGEGEGSGGGNE